MTKPTSLVTFLLDRSGSMRLCKDATIEGFNAYLATLKAEQDASIDFTFLQFDTIGLDLIHLAVPVSDAQPLTNESYQPRGGTPLIDASVRTIRAVEKALAERVDKPRVAICIQTDGEENSSRSHTWEELKALIAEKTEAGWAFNFMGAGIDAYEQGARMGISRVQTMSYNSADMAKTQSAFLATASNAGRFASAKSSNTSYSVGQKCAAGDAFDPAVTRSTTAWRRGVRSNASNKED